MSRDWKGVHTCHADCPCQTGGEPSPDFLPVEGSLLPGLLTIRPVDRRLWRVDLNRVQVEDEDGRSLEVVQIVGGLDGELSVTVTRSAFDERHSDA